MKEMSNYFRAWRFLFISIVITNAYLSFQTRSGKYISIDIVSRNSYVSYTSHTSSTILQATILPERTVDYSNTDEVLQAHLDEIIRLRGTPELVDRLENLVSKYPGLEVNIDTYKAIYPFPLDQFQIDGLTSLMKGNSVLVSTPTGSGKTVVGELAIYFALMVGLRVAYTTPLKALSNQKYQDFKNKYGADRVGLLTGDIAINRGATITIMTTEVFRNIIYDSDSASQLSNLFMVCFDEFHFMNDPDRGTVWEESVISCPPSVRILALSATMGNVDEIRGWMSTIHGPTDLILSTHRPVPLRYLYAMKQGLMPLFRDPNSGPGSLNGVIRIQGKLGEGSVLNPSIIKLEEQMLRKPQQRQTRSGRPFKEIKPNLNTMIPKYSDISEKLQKLNLLPAIMFIFSRVGCEDAAKQLTQEGLRLLNEAEIQYMNQAISAFIKANPEIPVTKSSIQMLRSGVGVHHAGLIPVWKAFIEDLFNANKIKVLFATETLAAGVNMPARTTVITTVTKRVNSEIIKLKTSQLLQMAGRAGRRGKDEEGTVVLVKNRFEESRVGHKILTSPIDDIKSHFKTSYGLTIKLLQTRDIVACKSLIERGFGSYLLSLRMKKKETENKKEIEVYRSILQKYTLKTAREYYKLFRRYEKEKRNEEFLIEKLIETETDLVQAISDYMPLGVGILLRNDESGYFLGDVKWGNLNENKGYGVLTTTGNLYIVQKEHIRCFAETTMSLSPQDAQVLMELISIAYNWKELPGTNTNINSDSLNSITPIKKSILQGVYSFNDIPSNSRIYDAYSVVKNSQAIPIPPLPGSVVRQKVITNEIYEELKKSPVYIDNQGELVTQALQYAATLRDPTAFVANGMQSNNMLTTGSQGDVYAWRMFENVVKVLRQYKALNGTVSTEFGDMIGSLSGENELWLAIVLNSSLLHQLNEAELGAVMSSIVVDGYKASNAFFKYPASEKVQVAYEELEKMSWDLRVIQADASLEFPINLCKEVGGLAESWINGVTWRELCRDTSLDQGDICRILRRTVEILRQIPQAMGISPRLADIASRAADRMDRFPVAELDAQTGEIKDTSGVGFGLNVAVPARGENDQSLLEEEGDEDSVLDIDLEVYEDGDSDDVNNKIDLLIVDRDEDSMDNIDTFLKDEGSMFDYLNLSSSNDNRNNKDKDKGSIDESLENMIEDLTKLTKDKLRLRRAISNPSQSTAKTSTISGSTSGRKNRLNENDLKGNESDGTDSIEDIDLDELLGITIDKTTKGRDSPNPMNSINNRNNNDINKDSKTKKTMNAKDERSVFGKKEYNIFREKFNADDISDN